MKKFLIDIVKTERDACDYFLCVVASLVFIPFIVWSYIDNDIDNCFALIISYIFMLGIFYLGPYLHDKMFGE